MPARLRRTTDFADLALHVLAHVPLPGPGDLHDPRYVKWAAATIPEASRPIAENGELLARACARDESTALALQALPILFPSIESFALLGRAPFTELDATLCDPVALATLRRADTTIVEIMWADLALAAPAYAHAHEALVAPEVERGIARMQQHFELAASLSSEARDLDVEVAHALRARGRAYGRRIVVGSPVAFCEDLDPAIPAVVALHERWVADADRAPAGTSPTDRWALAEWAALVGLAKALDGAAPSLTAAHASWLASLSLTELVGAARSLGLCAADLADRLLDAGDRRAEVLREAGDGGPTVG